MRLDSALEEKLALVALVAIALVLGGVIGAVVTNGGF